MGRETAAFVFFWGTESNIVDKQDTDTTRFYVIIMLI